MRMHPLFEAVVATVPRNHWALEGLLRQSAEALGLCKMLFQRHCPFETASPTIPPLSDWIRHVVTKWIYPYPYPVVITSLVADQVDTDPNL